jgi:mRNA-degrading endonuclease RelE of RelBE toxin-antitoxin system
MSWTLGYSTKAKKQYEKLPIRIRKTVNLLALELIQKGPMRGNWKNYSKISNAKHHCHLKSGKPTYVACWEVKDKTIKIIEVYYVGTHEKAPY